MNELIKITINEEGEQLVSGRELHDFLEVKTRFNDWIKNRIGKYGFEAEIDYTKILVQCKRGQNEYDYIVTTDMAKELSMVENNDKGRMARKYFIECEKKLKERSTPRLPQTYKEALLQLVEQVERNEKLELENKQKDQVIGELKPKADYTDVILKSVDALTITQIAKDYGLSGQTMNKTLHDLGVQYKQSGQWLLYSKYQSCGYTKSDTYKYENNNGEVRTKINTKWTQKGRLFLYNLLKENDILPLIEKVQEAA
ncbi:phage antirepressor KilAC domain-containing protein [Clostridium perfringens]|jgi:anti-repressor protein|uniref:Phage antirepressor KilAC domain-containing protein n=1 Tax=Clostridium perfringens TaxID=1502 RepID=A0AAW4J3Q4_CLOPF|nr:phage antirepressor KilAC domain-containing protein [Clostridium perfringens]MBO3356289.1 phage antirepressor KilAC domain-containing protein [Clostridium perfringens]MBO3359580.1 phage antirepressor KilAC domain-containing protein [Clostridium perfringens]